MGDILDKVILDNTVRSYLIFAGIALIVVGVIVSEMKPFRWFKSRQARA